MQLNTRHRLIVQHPAIAISSAFSVLVFSTAAFADDRSRDTLAQYESPRRIKWYRSPDGKIVGFSAIAEYRKAVEEAIRKEWHGTWSDSNSELCFVVSLGTTGNLLSVEIIDAEPASIDQKELSSALAAIHASKFPTIPESFKSTNMAVPISFYKLSKQYLSSKQNEKPDARLNQ